MEFTVYWSYRYDMWGARSFKTDSRFYCLTALKETSDHRLIYLATRYLPVSVEDAVVIDRSGSRLKE